MERVLQPTEAQRVGYWCISQRARGGQMKSILDPSFRYTKSVETDLRKTFARVRRELRKQNQEAESTLSSGVMRKVLPFHSRKAGL
jgi:hypothetical protein